MYINPLGGRLNYIKENIKDKFFNAWFNKMTTQFKTVFPQVDFLTFL